MATSEAETSHDERASPGGSVYDGFISYSHAADDLLAPRLQAGLQRFAKPWWKRRALRIFRDESSLAANPHLWSSITDALDQSGWFVLLLSPDAAKSAWVNREVEFWLAHKDADRIIPVLTDGDFGWVKGGVAGDAVPPALSAAFSDEPRWVDLRFAVTEEQLDLKNPQFSAAVADVASAIRGVPKDELESEEVRQHRRTVRTVWGAGVALVVLVVVAGAAAIFANGQRNEANEQRLAAVESASEADAQRQVAEEQTSVAETQSRIAGELAFDARSDALAATAIAQLDIDPELSLLLAVRALQREPQQAAQSATHQALQRNRTLFQISVEPGDIRTATAVGGLSPAGDLLAVTGFGRDLEVWEVGGDEPLWTFRYPESAVVRSARFTDDGTAIVVLVRSDTELGPQGIVELSILDVSTHQEVTSTAIPGCAFGLFPSALGDYVDVTAPIPWVINEGCNQRQEVGLFDLRTGSFIQVTEITAGLIEGASRYGVPTTDANGRYLAVGAGGPGQVVDTETGLSVLEYDGGISTLSADGTRLLASADDVGRPLELWDLAALEPVWAFPKVFTRAWFSNDESIVYGTSPDGSTYVLDAVTGEPIFRLVGQEGTPIAATMSADGNRLATFATDFTARVWDLGAMRSEGATYTTSSQPRPHMAAGAELSAGVAAVWGGAPHREQAPWEITVVDLKTGESFSVVGGAPALSPDGTRLAYRSVEEVEVRSEDFKEDGDPGVYPRIGPVRIIDVTTGDLIREIDVSCQQYLLPREALPSTDCGVASAGLEWDLEFSPDGHLLGMADSYDDVRVVWNATTGETVFRDVGFGTNNRAVAFAPDQEHVVFQGAGGSRDSRLRAFRIDSSSLAGSISLGAGTTFAEMAFTPDGSLLVAAQNNGDIALIDATRWDLLEPIPAHLGSVLDVAISPDGLVIASAGEDGYVRVWKAADRSLVTEIRFDVPQIANVEFIDNTHLFVTPGFGSEAIVVTLDSDELLEIARSRLIRSFTDEECEIFSIDPCPTLKEIKSGSA